MREIEAEILDQFEWRTDGIAREEIITAGWVAHWSAYQMANGNYEAELFVWSHWLRATHWQPGEWGNERQHIFEAETIHDLAEMIEEHLPQ